EDMGEAHAAAVDPRRKRVDHIGFDEVETRLAGKMAQIVAPSRVIAVEADDRGALGKERLTQVGADEPRSTGDQGRPVFSVVHQATPSFRVFSCRSSTSRSA